MPETANTELIPLETLRTVFPRICVLAPKDNEPHRFGYVLVPDPGKDGVQGGDDPLPKPHPGTGRTGAASGSRPGHCVTRRRHTPGRSSAAFAAPPFCGTWNTCTGADEHSNARHRELKQNAPAFDYVFYGANDAESIRILKRLGCSRVGHVYPNRFDPAIYRKLDIDKAYDVTFVGTLSPRRKHILATLGKQFKVDYKSIWDIDEQVRFFNQSRIVLHINSFDFLGGSFVNLRVFDVLGCGSFMLTEDQVVHDQFKDGEHLAYWNYGDADDLVSKVRFYLENEEARETIARQGHQYINDNFSAEKSLIELLSKVDLNLRAGRIDRGSWSLGTDKWGRATESIGDWRHFAELWTDSDCPLSYLERGPDIHEYRPMGQGCGNDGKGPGAGRIPDQSHVSAGPGIQEFGPLKGSG